MSREAEGAKWHCAKCQVETQLVNTLISYRGVTEAAKSMRCPKCGVVYLAEDFVVGTLADFEKYIDEKEM